MVELITPWVFGAVLSGLLLSIEHLLLWEIELNAVWRYTLGVAALNIGMTLALVMSNNWVAAVGIWAVAGVGGIVVAPLHKWRASRQQLSGEDQSRLLADNLVARARGEGRRVTPGER